MSELKPCPFCGKERLAVDVNDRSPNQYPFSAHVLCLTCLGSIGSHGFCPTEDEAKAQAIAAWNRRPSTARELSVKELEQMHGQPVWCVENPNFTGAKSGWGILGEGEACVTQCFSSHALWLAKYREIWTAYTAPPKEG